jgi:membrane protein DedA with SNARE-associated domain
MNMASTLAAYILKYGYVAIFSLVFLQEIGIPNPVPNELVLLFSGYLTAVGKLDFITVLLIVIAADTLGSSLLYVAFYFLTRIIHQPQKSTKESTFDVRTTPEQAHHRIIRLRNQAHLVVLALHQSVE